MEQFNVYFVKFDKELAKYPQIIELEKKTNIPKAYLVGGFLAFTFFFIFFNVFGEIIATLLGVLWPAYQSFKAIDKQDKALTTKWLTYWVVYGFLSIIELFSDVLLYWIPYYYAFKALLVVYLVHPRFDGAIVVYNNILEPYLDKNDEKIDENLAKIKKKVSQIFDGENETDQPLDNIKEGVEDLLKHKVAGGVEDMLKHKVAGFFDGKKDD
ncbi:hypothetical protein BCR33DRAFT_720585 [Rhizoclosmatium globosum]|uniref:Protein YOP1 n=1 Tax=Rhizoclosmatium globosum TaxID=329046 RepID=A0A1Y2BV31_9FUNG|nr:ER membrane protein DP1/Yop1 [Rhizoclosmatium sp. JEL0117]ORY38534.1 hypothetical protein BCR33DRAFT_720585 [Rhizoclosmatium globosum]|eukprot:ORY38534.1 hypothetical protein BCR33DRAFT_720585 [Rhizoclosmatium globosum]